MGMVYKMIGFRRQRYAKQVLGEIGIQKDRFQTNWHAKEYVLDESYIHKDKLCYMHKDELYTQGHGIDVYIYIYTYTYKCNISMDIGPLAAHD